MIDLTVQGLSVEADGNRLVEAASFRLSPGELIAVLGPNGAGKTSLVRACLGLAGHVAGSSTLGGVDIKQLNPMVRAKQLAYLPQIRPLAWPNLVRDVVALGRFSHGTAMGKLKPVDAAAIERAITACDLTHLANRRVDTLSGGELARMHFARALAAETPLMIADEPTAALDPRHQFRVMDLIKSFVADGGGALVILHDIQLAAHYASRLIWMKDGRICADGPPEETLTADRLKDIYGVRASVEGTRIILDGAL